MFLRSPRKGVAATELAILLPFLMFIWVITVDWARIFYYTVTLQYAARDGAYWGSDYPAGGQIYSYSSVSEAALGETTNITPTPTVACYSTTSPNPATATWVIYNGTPPAPAGTTYIKVEVGYTFQTITGFPGVPNSTPLTRTAIMKNAPAVPTN